MKSLDNQGLDNHCLALQCTYLSHYLEHAVDWKLFLKVNEFKMAKSK